MSPHLSTGKVFVVSAPSATGKTTIIRALIDANPQDVDIAISVTTRPIRINERDGHDYRFVSPAEFEKRIASGDMLEWANVHGHFYGSSRTEIQKILDRGLTPIMIIDVQGWLNARKTLAAAKSIFIMPPHVDALWARMEQRGTDGMETRWRRLQTARHELEYAKQYDYFVINDQLEHAVSEMQDIIIKGKKPEINQPQGCALASQLLDDLQHAAWYRNLQKTYESAST